MNHYFCKSKNNLVIHLNIHDNAKKQKNVPYIR